MKYWQFTSRRWSEVPCITLVGLEDDHNYNAERIVEIGVDKESGNIIFEDGCDNAYAIALRPQDAIQALEEVIQWIKEQTS
jgi:hypothetical protein